MTARVFHIKGIPGFPNATYETDLPRSRVAEDVARMWPQATIREERRVAVPGVTAPPREARKGPEERAERRRRRRRPGS